MSGFNGYIEASSAKKSTITSEYSSSSTYAVGDYCIHDNVLYRCTTEISTAEAWTSAHWTATNVDAELDRKVNKSDVVNNLTSTATDKPGSAAMLKKLNDEKQPIISDAGVGFTVASGITSGLFIRRYGNVVCINGYVQYNTNFPASNTFIGTIEGSNKPSGVIRAPAHTASAAYEVGSPAYVAIGTQGGIEITAASGTAHKYAYFSVSYIV